MRRAGSMRRLAVFSATVWFVAGVAILRPASMTRLANLVGIGRGADLVMYVMILAVLVLASYFYTRMIRAEESISRIVRHLAIREALGDQLRRDSRPEDDSTRPEAQRDRHHASP